MRLNALFSSLTACTILLTVSPLKAERPDLTGAWRLDTAASSLSMGPAPTAGTLAINKRKNVFHFAEAMTLPEGAKSREYDWKTDDRFHPINGPGSGEVLAHWKGDVLMGDHQTGDGSQVESITWSLRDSGTLVETIHRPGQSDSTLVWKH